MKRIESICSYGVEFKPSQYQVLVEKISPAFQGRNHTLLHTAACEEHLLSTKCNKAYAGVRLCSPALTVQSSCSDLQTAFLTLPHNL